MKPGFFSGRKAYALLLLPLLLISRQAAYSQVADSSQIKLAHSITGLSDKGLALMKKSYASLQADMEKQTAKLLKRMQNKEEKLQKKLNDIDSVKSQALFAQTKAQYAALEKQMQNPPVNPGMAQTLKTYVPHLDSMQTALKYLQTKGVNLPTDKLQQIQSLSSQLQQLQGKLQSANQVQVYLQQREQLLKQQLSNLNVGKQLVGINKETYYYQQRLNNYKSMMADKDKLKQTIISTVSAQPAFQKFWQKNSMLASMFPLPGGNEVSTDSMLTGLQTRAQVGALINEKVGKGVSAGTNSVSQASGSNYLSQQVQTAKSQLDELKQKARQYAGGGGSDMVIPDFKPNSQKTKSFLKRIEYGFNIQNSPSSNWLPATSNIALSLGYKISDKATAGVGIAYLLGWGTPVKDIHFSSQGIGLRSYVDIKAKGSLWVTGGFEYNYMLAFASINDIRNLDVWQKSALAGFTKKYKVGNKTANLQLLYDFLAGLQVPRAQPIKFRVGYTF